MIVVVLGEQRGGIETDGLGQGPDVTAGVDVAATGVEVVRLDGVHDGDADPGGGTDVVDGQSGRDTRLLEGTTDRGAGFLTVVFERTLVFRGVAEGHGGAFRAF